jgi:hypothetical protein
MWQSGVPACKKNIYLEDQDSKWKEKMKKIGTKLNL